MAIEIERKFLVANDCWRSEAGPGRRFCQGYVARNGMASVRVRRADTKAFLTVKGPREGIARPEFEYAISVDDAEDMFDLCAKPLLEKTRYCVKHAGADWEVDVFEGPAKGLVIAEIELKSEDERISIPAWVGREVTDDPAYRTSSIANAGAPG